LESAQHRSVDTEPASAPEGGRPQIVGGLSMPSASPAHGLLGYERSQTDTSNTKPRNTGTTIGGTNHSRNLLS